MNLTIWRDYFMADLISPLVDASLQLVERSRAGDLVDMQLVACLVRCLGKTCLACSENISSINVVQVFLSLTITTTRNADNDN